MELFLIGIAVLLTSGLTLFSGFGLGTILMPVFALLVPVPLAKHPHVKQEMQLLFGSTTLTAANGATLALDYLQHVDNWCLCCKRPGGGKVALQPVSE